MNIENEIWKATTSADIEIENEINDDVRRRTSMRRKLYVVCYNILSTSALETLWNDLDIPLDDEIMVTTANTLYENEY